MTSPRAATESVRDAAVNLARYLTPEESFTPTQRRETVALLLDFAEAVRAAAGEDRVAFQKRLARLRGW